MTDFWRHEIREDRLGLGPGRSYPGCIDRAHACPPEECGEPQGYVERRVEAVAFDALEDLATLADLIFCPNKGKQSGLGVFVSSDGQSYRQGLWDGSQNPLR